MEYRTAPRLGQMVSVIGFGSGNMHEADEGQTFDLIDYAQEQGVNLIDLALSKASPLDHYGAALRGRRDQFILQMHLGMSFETGEYARDYSLESVKRSFDMYLGRIGTNYTDIALFHCIDSHAEVDALMDNGVFQYALDLKKSGNIRHIGFASHTVDIARRFIDTGEIDVFMFSINAAYDFDPAALDPYGADSKTREGIAVARDRQALYQECARQGIGITVMKAFGGGKLLDGRTSPLGRAMTAAQCIRYALDRPAVLSCLPGVRGREDLAEALTLYSAPEAELDYSFISGLRPGELAGSCVYCNHCMPCPAGIDIGRTNKFFDLYMAGDVMAREHYLALENRADRCTGCGVCEGRCPFGVAVRERMARTAAEMQ